MKKKVLVVDDSRFVYEELKDMFDGTEFEAGGYCVRGEEAVQAYGSTKPDAVSMDIILPGIDGFEATERLLESYPDAKIVILSSLAYDETEEKAMEVGARAFVFKPFSREDILSALRYAVSEETGGPPAPNAAGEAESGRDR